MSNTQITDEIQARLERHPRIPHPTEVAISERDGAVTLRGSVGSIPQRFEAVRVAKSVSGVRSVDDQLTVDLRDSWPDDQVRGVALQALISNVDVPDERIDVRVSDGWLTLKGEVRRQSESDSAFEAAARVPGIGGITNEIKVITAGLDG
jgi:osmotically-inducible protein OsmY